jgi:hypothetical protein
MPLDALLAKDLPVTVRHLVVMAAQHEVRAEVEILLRAVAGDECGGEFRPQSAPNLSVFLPGRDFLDRKTGQRHQEWRVQISPHGIAVEVGAIDEHGLKPPQEVGGRAIWVRITRPDAQQSPGRLLQACR